MPLGLISSSFLSCNLPLHKGQSKVMYLLVGFCSLLKSTVVGSSSDSSKSSGIGCFLNLCCCATKLAQTTSEHYFVLQSLHKARSSTTLHYRACAKEEKQRLDAGKRARFCSFLHRHGDARGKAETRDKTRGRSKSISCETSSSETYDTWHQTSWNVTKYHDLFDDHVDDLQKG